MDKALASGAGDCGFESHRDHKGERVYNKNNEAQLIKPSEKKALEELRKKLEKKIKTKTLRSLKPREKEEDEEEEVSLWGVPLLPSKQDEGTNPVLIKFLRAREFKANEAMEMLERTLLWRKEHKIEKIMEEDELENEKVMFIDGIDKEGHPVCYNNIGLWKWRRRREDVNEEKSEINGGRDKEMRTRSMKAVSVLQDNYPELVHKNIFVNVSFGYYVYNALVAPFISQRSKSKFIFARPQKVTETLLKFISPERLPIQYGGLKRDNDNEFKAEDEVSEMYIRGGEKETIEILIHEAGVTVVWDITVVGWEVTYKEEFIPDDEGSYRVLIRKEMRMGQSMRNSFHISEPGKEIEQLSL
ncbi:patellin-4-like [Dioscorea cayenensis subsp. rotundata]|uniref:Patellin-4-like n=1 Tax=Dioscorea cayennensis subsp. rotundata TaxID=55577 RepID=A0AB40B4J4_DIOCR|nr:patellin-4-like [Dioscorea cayenensis subsp. rotundata]